MNHTFSKLLSGLAAIAALAGTSVAQAGAVTVGSLTRNTPNTINDTLNNRTWLGWDVTAGLSYAQTVSYTEAGGMFAGYRIARNNDAQMFVNALLGSNSCTTANGGVCAEGTTAQIAAITGDSYRANHSTFDDIVFFLSDNGIGSEVGAMGSAGDSLSTDNSENQFLKFNENSTIAFADTFAGLGPRADTPVGWLLYRDNAPVNAVPEPGTLALLAAGAVGAAVVRRRQRAQYEQAAAVVSAA